MKKKECKGEKQKMEEIEEKEENEGRYQSLEGRHKVKDVETVGF